MDASADRAARRVIRELSKVDGDDAAHTGGVQEWECVEAAADEIPESAKAEVFIIVLEVGDTGDVPRRCVLFI